MICKLTFKKKVCLQKIVVAQNSYFLNKVQNIGFELECSCMHERVQIALKVESHIFPRDLKHSFTYNRQKRRSTLKKLFNSHNYTTVVPRLTNFLGPKIGS